MVAAMTTVTINGRDVLLPPTERLVQALSGRPRGFAPWNPQGKSLAVVDAVKAVLLEYSSYLPLTVRQIYYRLVGTEVIGKTQADYENLCEKLSRARRARLISFDDIRDDGVTREEDTGNVFDSGEEMSRYALSILANGRLPPGQFQPVPQYVVCEAAGMVPQIARVAQRFAAITLSSGGFDSVTAKYNLACELIGQHRPCIVWHIGDFDQSGCHVFQSLNEDVHAFIDGWMPGFERSDVADVAFRRLAVTEAQIAEYGLPQAPMKKSDVRTFNGSGTVQAEALAPDIMAKIVEDALSTYYCKDAELVAQEATKEARREAAGIVARRFV
jgi:hypothetical protein